MKSNIQEESAVDSFQDTIPLTQADNRFHLEDTTDCCVRDSDWPTDFPGIQFAWDIASDQNN